MNLNEDSYLYIRHVADQIEGLTCALIVYIENAGRELESYHYEAFNKFSNEIRDMEISVSKEIRDEFVGVKEAIEESAIKIRASESSISQLRSQLADTEGVLSRLVIHSENIREFNSDTSNPYVPNASEEVYRAFSGYERLLNQYSVNPPLESDTISRLMYSFFWTVSGLFERLFNEYDSLLQDFGVDVEEKRKNLGALTVIKKREGRKDIAKAAMGVAKTAAFAALGIKKKNAFDVVESGVGLLAKINDTLEELDELKYAKPKRSLARKVLKGIATYNDAMELVGGTIGAEGAGAEAVGVDFEVPTLAKLAIAIPVAMGKAKSLESWKESGALDVATSALGMIESGINLGAALAFGKGASEVIKKVPDLGSSGLGLVEKAAKYVNKTYEKDPSMVDKKDEILQKLGACLKEYNKEVEQYNIAKERKLMAVKKPKAPPFITAQGIFDKLKKGVDCIEEGSEVVEYIKGIL
ncbi:MAG: hypothetical protein GX285_10650 [Clostridiales bacterium]|nr:hypothetical protein [Clostridiales bacterium]